MGELLRTSGTMRTKKLAVYQVKQAST